MGKWGLRNLNHFSGITMDRHWKHHIPNMIKSRIRRILLCANILTVSVSVKGSLYSLTFSMPVLWRHKVNSEKVSTKFGLTMGNGAEHFKDVGDTVASADLVFNVFYLEKGREEEEKIATAEKKSDERPIPFSHIVATSLS